MSHRLTYRSSLIGTIRTQLSGLHGYDIIAFELLQNADDAKAKEITFKINNDGLEILNSARFSDCGNLDSDICATEGPTGKECDFHHIIHVSGGGKASDRESIGQFGIGFLSTYQITDRPEIHSGSKKLTLEPDTEGVAVEEISEVSGTRFFLPWARETDSTTRQKLRLDGVSDDNIGTLSQNFRDALQKGLYFLRYISKASLYIHEKEILSVSMDRADHVDHSEIIVTSSPTNKVEFWLVFRDEQPSGLTKLNSTMHRLREENRKTEVALAIRKEPEPLGEDEGMLYAYLPTQESSKIRGHINAHFFPHSDRKRLIFDGDGHQRIWNETVLDTAAEQLASKLETLLDELGFVSTWELIDSAFEAKSDRRYSVFWRHIRSVVEKGAKLAVNTKKERCSTNELILPTAAAQNLSADEVDTLIGIGAILPHDDLLRFKPALSDLGARRLSLDLYVELLEQNPLTRFEVKTLGLERVSQLASSIWSILDKVITKNASGIDRLHDLPILLTISGTWISMKNCYVMTGNLTAAQADEALPEKDICCIDEIKDYKKLLGCCDALTLQQFVTQLEHCLGSLAGTSNPGAMPPDTVEEFYLSDLSDDRQRAVYDFISDLAENYKDEVDFDSVIEDLKELKIWKTRRSFVMASEALIPGNFQDPIGGPSLIINEVLSKKNKNLLSEVLDVGTQTIENFVQKSLPVFFQNNGPKDQSKYSSILEDLARHPELLNDSDARNTLTSLHLVSCINGNWCKPDSCYYQSEELLRILGNRRDIWIDEDQIPSTPSVASFLASIGVSDEPRPRHLIDRLIQLAENYPPDKDIRASFGITFRQFAEFYDENKYPEEINQCVVRLKQQRIFPSRRDFKNWHQSSSVYAPFEAEAFDTQAEILAINGLKPHTELLRQLGIKINPEPRLVIQHLLDQSKSGREINPVAVYRLLNQYGKENPSILSTLVGEKCIYLEDRKEYFYPSQVFWQKQNLGDYAVSLPATADKYRNFYDAIDVKETPAATDYARIAEQIIIKHDSEQTALSDDDFEIYEHVLLGATPALDEDATRQELLAILGATPCAVNQDRILCFPSDVLIKDSDWHAEFLGPDINRCLCSASRELWRLLEHLGIERLSRSLAIDLHHTEGNEQSEEEIENRLQSHKDIVIRLLHDKSRDVLVRTKSLFSDLRVVSYDTVEIKPTLSIGNYPAAVSPRRAAIFLEIDSSRLFLERPFNSDPYSDIYRSILHPLLPEEQVTQISKDAGYLALLARMSEIEAHDHLDKLNIPSLEKIGFENIRTLPESAEMPDHSADVDIDEDEDEDKTYDLSRYEDEATPAGTVEITGSNASEEEISRAEQTRVGIDQRSPDTGNNGQIQGRERGQKAKESSKLDDHAKERTVGSPGHSQDKDRRIKKDWNMKMRSYVGSNEDDSSDSPSEDATSKRIHNIKVEDVTRAEVCDYERSHGRDPLEMHQTHPGYDIESTDPNTGEKRFIEVKGVTGAWNNTGVGLSSRQYDEAQKSGSQFWLYVVEFASDSDRCQVHAIQNPFSRVTDYMFDGNWRDLAENETNQLKNAFRESVWIKDKRFGTGKITKREETKQGSVYLTIEFERLGRPNEIQYQSLNLSLMDVIPDGEIDD